MRFFKRRSSDSTASTSPNESYYQTQPEENKGMAWLLAFATFAVTLIVILSLFFGGRWLYHKIANRGDSSEAPQPETAQNEAQNEGSSQTPPPTSQPTPSSTPNNNPTSSGGSSSAPSQSVQGNTSTPPQTSSTSTATPSPASQPVTGPTELVRTGPDADL